MRIGMELPHGAGIGRYGTNLIRYLVQLDPETAYLLFPGAWRQLDLALQHETDQGSRFLWRQVVLPRDLSRHRVDLFHGLFPSVPLFWTPTITTIYDMTPLLLPEYMLHNERLLFGLFLGIYVRRAGHILTISEQSKRDIIRLLHVPPDKVSIAFPAAETRFRPMPHSDTWDGVLQQYGIACPFILFVGTLEPRKNIVTLVKAYAALRSSGRIAHQLVIVGRKGWLYDEIFETVDMLGLGRNVIFTGAVPDHELAYLYNAATLFVYPSFYEGFGLPPLEAMACGTPVITSCTSSLPEVVGDAGLMVDPRNVEELTCAMTKILGNEALRHEMKEKGLQRASVFSWAETAKQTLRIYEKVLGRRENPQG